MESLRLMSQRSRASGTFLNVVPGRAVASANVDVDSIHGPLEVYSRARAWFMTMAFLNIRKQAWFDLQTAIFASDKIFELVQQTSSGMSPPVAHFVVAWASTVYYFSEQVRISGQPLLSVVVNTGAWEHRWMWTAPADGHGPARADLHRDVQANVDQMREQARQWQSQVDRQRAENARANGSADQKGKGAKGNKGGGKGKGKGKDRRDYGSRRDNERERSRRR